MQSDGMQSDGLQSDALKGLNVSATMQGISTRLRYSKLMVNLIHSLKRKEISLLEKKSLLYEMLFCNI